MPAKRAPHSIDCDQPHAAEVPRMAETDPSLFVRLLLQHQNDLLRYILPLVGCLDDAQDVLQETATALWRKFDQYDPDCPFLPWAKRFAHHEVLMCHRRRRRYTFLSDELIESLIAHQAEQEREAEQWQEALQDCVNKLSEADRELLNHRYAEPGTTIQRLAAQTGQTPNVLYKTLARIRRQLLHCVGKALALTGAT
jgi:RNA polymerase sigma-70 factor, ECF subfamily